MMHLAFITRASHAVQKLGRARRPALPDARSIAISLRVTAWTALKLVLGCSLTLGVTYTLDRLERAQRATSHAISTSTHDAGDYAEDMQRLRTMCWSPAFRWQSMLAACR